MRNNRKKIPNPMTYHLYLIREEREILISKLCDIQIEIQEKGGNHRLWKMEENLEDDLKSSMREYFKSLMILKKGKLARLKAKAADEEK